MSYDRMDRVDEELRRELVTLISRELKDPRISEMVTVMGVEVTRDLRYAKVRVSVMGDAQQRKDTLKGLKSAAGFMRRELSRRLQLRTVPELQFVEDTSVEYSIHISKVLQEVLPAEPQKDDDHA